MKSHLFISNIFNYPYTVFEIRTSAESSSESKLFLADAVMYRVQEELMKLSAVLMRQGLAAFGVAIEQEVAMMQRLVAGPDGERNLTDFLQQNYFLRLKQILRVS